MEVILASVLGIVPLKSSALTIGRSPNNDLFINNAAISRHHAEVRPAGSDYCIVDLGSTSGTFVNGERLASQVPRLLHPGDVIQVGSLSITYQEKRPAQLSDGLTASPIISPSSPGRPLPGTTARPDNNANNVPVMPPGLLSLSTAANRPLRAPEVARGRPINLALKQLQFTAFYPRTVPVESWNALFVYAHIEETLEVVRGDARRLKELLGSEPFKNDAWSALPLKDGTQITVVPVFQGITFQPERISFPWTNNWHPTAFRFSADRRWAGTISTGEVMILAGPLIVASLRVSLRFAGPGSQPDREQEEISVTRYKNIFTSYSHNDAMMVQAIRQVYEAIGDSSFRDLAVLRSSPGWNSTLPQTIDGADVFQLFWSRNAAQSQSVYQECQYALQHYKYDGFIRSIYWEKPLAFSPPEFSRLHFTFYELPA